MSLIDKIKTGSDASKTVDWPGIEDAKIKLRVCTEHDNLQASLATDMIFKGHLIGAENIDAYNSERSTQLLFRAICDPENGNQLYAKITEFRLVLSPEVKESLDEALDELHQEYNPDPSSLSEEAFDALVEDVKKNPEAALTNVFDTHTLKRLSIFLASQL